MENSKNFAGSQEQYDAYAVSVISTLNAITHSCDAYTKSGEIISVELITGNYARIGKQVGLRITTAPDVEKLSIGSEKFASVSAMLQTVKLDQNGMDQDTLVKVWVVTFDHEITSEQSVTYTDNTYLTGDIAVAGTCDKTVRFQ